MAVTVLDDNEGRPGKGQAKFRVFNTSTADPDKVDVYLVTTACNDTRQHAGGTDGFERLRPSGRLYPARRPREHRISCASPAPGDKSDLRLEVPSFVLSEKRIVTVILTRGAGGFLLNAIVLDQQGGPTQALNASARVRAAT